MLNLSRDKNCMYPGGEEHPDYVTPDLNYCWGGSGESRARITSGMKKKEKKKKCSDKGVNETNIPSKPQGLQRRFIGRIIGHTHQSVSHPSICWL